MLKVNIGLSRKLSENYNSHGFSINLEGEVCAELRDTETVIDRIQQYYDLADEALLRQMERYESDMAIASHDAEPAPLAAPPQTATAERKTPTNRVSQNGKTGREPATNKQLQYLLNLGKRQGLSKSALDRHLTERFGRQLTVYDLTKREAGLMLDELTSQSETTSSAK